MSHSDFIKSIRENDGRKWLIEERGGVSHYLEIAGDSERNPYAGGGEGPAAKRKRKVRETLAQKARRHEKPFTWKLGYNHCIGQFVNTDGDQPALTGSCLNRRKKKEPEKKELQEDRPPAVHYLSNRSRGKVKDKTTAFFRAIPKDRIFLTLTFIEHVDDWTGVKILNKFLTVVRKERPGFQYIWVAEHQPDRKQRTIHFHIVMNKTLAVKRYNALWVVQQYNAGLTGHRKDGSVIDRAEIDDRVIKGTLGKALNPMDVRRAYGVQGLAHYLAKYVTQQDKEDGFGCRNWHCSRKVSKLFTRQVVGPSTFAYLQSFVNYKLDRKSGECFPAEVYKKQFFTMIYIHNKAAPLHSLARLECINKWLLQDFQPDKVPAINDEIYRQIIYYGEVGKKKISSTYIMANGVRDHMPAGGW